MNRHVTHYLLGETDAVCWIPLYFITQDSDGNYFDGFEDVSRPKEEVAGRVETGELKKLDTAWPIAVGQGLWRTPYDDVWLANGPDPFEDHQRFLVQRGAAPVQMSKKEILFRRFKTEGKRPNLTYVPDDFVDDQFYGELVDDVAESLAKLNGANLLRNDGILASWEVLANYLEGHFVDFCGLPYNLHEARAPRFSVVQFGWQRSYTCYYNPKSTHFKTSGYPLFNEHLSPRDRIAQSFGVHPELAIGILQETTAANEVTYLFRDIPGIAKKGGIYGTADREVLKRWISEKPETRIVLCDHSIAEKLDEVDKDIVSLSKQVQFSHGADRESFSYTKALQVGFVYPKDDLRWAEDIRSATASAIGKILLVDAGYSKFVKALAPLRVELLTEDELRIAFGIHSGGTEAVPKLKQR